MPPMADACVQLNSCCALLEEDDQEDCEDLVADADIAACTEAVPELCPTSTIPSTMPTGDACLQLNTCCATLEDEDQDQCLDTAIALDLAACMESFDDLCASDDD
jgi:hypothetical protein